MRTIPDADPIPLRLGAKVVAMPREPIPEPKGVRWVYAESADGVFCVCQDSDLKHASAPKRPSRSAADIINEAYKRLARDGLVVYAGGVTWVGQDAYLTINPPLVYGVYGNTIK